MFLSQTMSSYKNIQNSCVYFKRTFPTVFPKSLWAHSLAPSSIVAMSSCRRWEHSFSELPMTSLNAGGGCNQWETTQRWSVFLSSSIYSPGHFSKHFTFCCPDNSCTILTHLEILQRQLFVWINTTCTHISNTSATIICVNKHYMYTYIHHCLWTF